jgi:hypothetical protein
MEVASETECSMCGITMHSFCMLKVAGEIEEATQIDASGLTVCSMTCYHLSAEVRVSPQIVRSLRGELMAKNKEALKKEAFQMGLTVNRCTGQQTQDLSKDEIVGRIVEKRLLMPLVSNEGADLADASTVPHASRVTISDKFRLINVIFSDEL